MACISTDIHEHHLPVFFNEFKPGKFKLQMNKRNSKRIKRAGSFRSADEHRKIPLSFPAVYLNIPAVVRFLQEQGGLGVAQGEPVPP